MCFPQFLIPFFSRKLAPCCALACFLVLTPALHARPQDKNLGPAAPTKSNPHNLSPELENLLRGSWDLYSNKHQDKAAQESLARALKLAETEKNLWGAGEAHRILGLIAIHAAKYPAAQSELEQAMTLFETVHSPGGVARVHMNLGLVASYMGKSAEAVDLYRKALSEFENLHDTLDQALVLESLAMIDVLPAGERVVYTERGLALAKEMGDKGLAGHFLHSIGDHLFAQGDYAAAVEKLNQAADLLNEVGDRAELATVWTSLGRLYRAHGAYDDAIASYKKGLSIQQELGDKQGVIQSLNAMAISYGLAAHDAEAMEHYEHALTLARETGAPRVISWIAGNVGCTFTSRPETYQRAIALLEESLRLDPSSVWTGNHYMCLAGAFLATRQFQRALENSDRAVEVERKKNDPDYFSQALQQRAKILRELQKYPEALVDIREATGVLEQVRAHLVPADYLKQGYAARTQDFFEDAIALHEKLGQHKEAMVVAEEARARAFLDLLAGREVGQQDRQRSISRSADNTTAPPSESKADGGKKEPDSVALTTRGPNSLVLGGLNGTPVLSSRASTAPPTFEELISTAKRLDSTFLSYWVMPDATFAWVLKPDGTVRSERIAISSQQLAKLIGATSLEEDDAQAQPAPATGGKLHSGPPINSALRGGQILRLRGGGELVLSSKKEQAWRELYKLLVLPLQDSLPPRGSHLIIVPQGPLFRLSLAALQDAHGHYLVENYALSYAPSLGVLRLTGERKRQLGKREPSYLIIADPQIAPDLAKDPGLPPLPGARQEARNLARLLPRGETTLLMGGDASKAAVRERAAGKTVLHLATHAIVRDDQPFDSFLVLSATDKSPPGDGRLSAQEIYGLDLQADLVVLSACRTALGKLSGDGIAGLTRAFFYGGAPSVMATLWDVADEPTSFLISDFYKALQKDTDKSRALRSAQLRLIHELRAGRIKANSPLGPIALPEDPIFWAGFVLQGEP